MFRQNALLKCKILLIYIKGYDENRRIDLRTYRESGLLRTDGYASTPYPFRAARPNGILFISRVSVAVELSLSR